MLVVVYYILRLFKAPSVDISVSSMTFLSWSLGFSGILLLPYDIAISLEAIKKTSLSSLWDTIYWRYTCD